MKKKKNILSLPDKDISFKELCEVRQTEMISMLPGLVTKVKLGNKEKWVRSPKIFERTLFGIK